MSSGEQLLDDAIERVELSSRDWIDAATPLIKQLAESNAMITSDDVWSLIDSPVEPRAMGAAFARARRAGWIVASDMTRRSERPEAHRRPIRLWTSNLFLETTTKSEKI